MANEKKYIKDYFPWMREEYCSSNTEDFDKLTCGSNIPRDWKCPKSEKHIWSGSPNERCGKKKRNCGFCCGKLVNETNNIRSFSEKLYQEWDWEENKRLDPDKVYYGSNLKVGWIDDKGHRWKARVRDRTRIDKNRTNCPICSNRKVILENCLAITHPHLLDEWAWETNKVSPHEIAACSNIILDWVCKNNPEHKWKTSPNLRASKHNQTDCPYCSNKKVNHTNCLATTHPHLLDEWNYNENILSPYKITAGSSKKVGFICPNGHEYTTEIRHRAIRGTGCSKCTIQYSKGHKEVVEYIQSIYQGKILINDRKTIKNPETGFFLELDILLPEKKFAIEYNGEYYHFKNETKERDKQKILLCKDMGIKLVQVWEKDWKNNKDKIYLLIRKNVK